MKIECTYLYDSIHLMTHVRLDLYVSVLLCDLTAVKWRDSSYCTVKIIHNHSSNTVGLAGVKAELTLLI